MEESFSKMRHSLFDCYEHKKMALRKFQSDGRRTKNEKKKVSAQGSAYKARRFFFMAIY